MRARDFILKEYSREKTAGVFGKKLFAAFQKDTGYFPSGYSNYHEHFKNIPLDQVDPTHLNAVIDYLLAELEGADPTANKEYVQWLAKVYANEGVKLEDLTSKTTEWLQKYDLYKKKKFFTGPDAKLANIMNLKWRDLWDISIRADFQMKIKQQEEKAMPRGNSELYYEDDAIRIIVPKDQEAACYFGQGTQWCTAATKGTNYFRSYSKDGPLYIILPKKPVDSNDKYQFHFESEQFMDATDHQVDLDQVVERYPSLRTAFSQQAKESLLLSLMSQEDSDEVKEQASQVLNSNGVVKHPGGIMTINLNNWQAENHLSTLRGIAVKLLSGVDVDTRGGDAEGGIAYAIVDPSKQLAKAMMTVEFMTSPAVMTSMSQDSYETFGGFNQIKRESPAMYAVAEQLDLALEKYMALIDEELEPGSEEDTQYLITHIYSKFGYPEE